MRRSQKLLLELRLSAPEINRNTGIAVAFTFDFVLSEQSRSRLRWPLISRLSSAKARSLLLFVPRDGERNTKGYLMGRKVRLPELNGLAGSLDAHVSGAAAVGRRINR